MHASRSVRSKYIHTCTHVHTIVRVKKIKKNKTKNKKSITLLLFSNIIVRHTTTFCEYYLNMIRKHVILGFMGASPCFSSPVAGLSAIIILAHHPSCCTLYTQGAHARRVSGVVT